MCRRVCRVFGSRLTTNVRGLLADHIEGWRQWVPSKGLPDPFLRRLFPIRHFPCTVNY